jgi:hypothetical protein
MGMPAPDTQSAAPGDAEVSLRPVDALSPASRARVGAVGALLGALLAMVWSYELVDEVIAGTVAEALLGYDAQESAITGSTAGALFAFVTGMAGTFTACNVAAFSAVAPLIGRGASMRRQVAVTVGPLGWLAAGMLAVSGAYGAVGAVMGDTLPQLSDAQTAAGMPVRLVQSSVVFGLIGAGLIYLGMAAMGAVPDVLAGLRARFAHIDLVVVGGLIGAFLIARPFDLFLKMFSYAAAQGNPLYGAGTFMLQSLGNVVLLIVMFLALVVGTRGRLPRWLAATPGRLARVSGGAFVLAGAFTLLYWTLRVPSIFGYGWFPTMPWA